MQTAKAPAGPSALTPADLARVGKPTGAAAAPAKSVTPAPASRDSASAIWDDSEVQGRAEAAQDADDGRRRPAYEILHGQHVGTEDVYLGLSDKTPSSLHCDRMVVRVLLPGECMADIDLDVTEQKVSLQSPR